MKFVWVIVLLILTATVIYLILRPDRSTSTASPRGSEPIELSDREIKAIIDEARQERADLPEPFPEYDWVASKQGSHYAYIEYGLPKSPGYNQIFKLNDRGAIVDVQFDGDPTKTIDCPDKVFSESELAAIIARARGARDDLPAPFPKFRTRVDRLRCLYTYYEYALPEMPGKHHVFIIDPYGELMEVYRSEPYQQ